ncbi:MAG: DEAD/DEAH box helicase [Acidimicrobiales bacterium]
MSFSTSTYSTDTDKLLTGPLGNWDPPNAAELFPDLRPYQRDGVAFLVRRDSALLADEMGLGKTVQTAVALDIVLKQPGRRRALIICPASLRLNWERELARWAPDLTVKRIRGSRADREAYYQLPIPVLIASYEQLRADAPNIANLMSFDLVMLDEAQRIKNRHSSTALACTILQRKASWALTATPVENSPNDLTSVLSFIKPGLARPGIPRVELHRRMQPYFLRRKKEDVLPDLPPIIEQLMPVELEGEQREAYEELWESRLGLNFDGQAGTEVSMLALITELKQLCNFHEPSGESVKGDVLDTIFDSMRESDDKTIVFSQYVETLRWLAERNTRRPSALFHGGLSEVERDQLLQDFANGPGPRVLYISLRAGGVGLNLQSASTVVMFDRWWNPAVEDQAIQRAHRFGRDRPLYVVKFEVVNSIEERIANVLKTKRITIDQYTEGAENADVLRLDRQELLKILDLGPPLEKSG